jgi:hypothetical protein
VSEELIKILPLAGDLHLCLAQRASVVQTLDALPHNRGL